MNRRDLITLLGGAAATWPLAARAQQGDKRQITIWMGRPNDAEGLRLAVAFREAFQALGWINGRNVRIDYRWVTSEIDRLSLAKEVVDQQPDVIVAETTAAVAALSRVNSIIPIVFVNVSDPIAGRHVPVLQQRIHERSIFRQPVVQVRSGSQTARPDASDRLPLLNPDTGMNAGRKRGQVEVLRDVPGCMPDLDHSAVRRIRCDRDHSS